MKKMMFLSLMLVSAFAFTSCDDDDDFNPDGTLRDALEEIYPGASYVDWERKGSYSVAEFWYENRELDVWFNSAAQWMMTETNISRNELPSDVLETLAASEYSTWRIDDLDMLEYPAKPTRYVVEVERGNREFNLYFTEAGVLEEARDVTNRDDTHWPE